MASRRLTFTLTCLSLLISVSSAIGQLCPEGPFSIGTSSIIPPCTICNSYEWGEVSRHEYISGEEGLNYGNVIGPDNTHYHDQWLDLYLPDTDDDQPLSVFVFAHSGSQYADDAFNNGRDFCQEGIAFISWESVQTSLAIGGSYYENDPELLMTIHDYWENTHADFDSVLTWVWNHAEEYNFDLSNIFVGGGSRGSRISFKDLDDPDHPVRGVYMTQAFADLEWFSYDFVQSQGCDVDRIEDFVTLSYPPMVLHYRNNLGDVNNSHDPLNGMRIQERYECYGLDSRIIHGLGDDYSWPPAAIDFIQHVDEYFFLNTELVVDSGIIDPESNMLSSPKEVQLLWDELDSTLLNIKWESDNWSENISGEPYLGIEPEVLKVKIRLGQVESIDSERLSDLCEPLELEVEIPMNIADDSIFHFLEGNDLLNSCAIIQQTGGAIVTLESGQLYGLQVQCNLTPSSNYWQQRPFRFWTPWSELQTFEGRCDGLTNGLDPNEGDVVIDIFPNPAEQVIHISRVGRPAWSTTKIQIMDITGQVRKVEKNWAEETTSIDVSRLPRGMYWVKISSQEKTITRRILKE